MAHHNLLIADRNLLQENAFNNEPLISYCSLTTIFSVLPPTPLRGVYPPRLRSAAPLRLRRSASLDRRAGGDLASPAARLIGC
jgi:hypothetical protein